MTQACKSMTKIIPTEERHINKSCRNSSIVIHILYATHKLYTDKPYIAGGLFLVCWKLGIIEFFLIIKRTVVAW